MKLPLRKRIAAAVRFILNQYDGARYIAGQPWRNQSFQDAKDDIGKYNRSQLAAKARDFERNDAITNKLCDLFEQFTVGAGGLVFTPNSSNPQWNLAAAEYWQEWQQVCDIQTLFHFTTLQSLVARSWFIDGEVFIKLTLGENDNPRIQLIESHRVETPPTRQKDEGISVIDGCEIDARGRTTGYWVREGQGKDTRWALVDKSEMIHVFEPSRPGQVRGISFLYPVMCDLLDLKTLQDLEMMAAKNNAEKANIVITPDGEIPVEDLIRGSTTAASSTAQQKSEYYTEQLGGRTIALPSGSDFKQFAGERPSVASREYWDYLTSKICCGVGISKLLVMPYSNQGTVVRADLETQAAYFRARSFVLIDCFGKVYKYVFQRARTNDPRLRGYPADWYKFKSRPPRGPNVDVGKNSNAMLAELKAGTRTFNSIYAELGEDATEQLTIRAQEAALIARLAAENNVTPAMVSDLALVPVTPDQGGQGNG